MTVRQMYLYGLLDGLVKQSAVLSPKTLSSLITGHSLLAPPLTHSVRPVLAVKPTPDMSPLLFYRSAHGTSGKVKGTWYPFFGLSKGDSWLIKGRAMGWKGDSIAQMERGYDSPEIKSVMSALNRMFGRRKTQSNVAYELFNKFRPLAKEYADLSKKVYGKPYFNFNPETNPGASQDAAFHIRRILRKTLGYENTPRLYTAPKSKPDLTPEQVDRLFKMVGFSTGTGSNVRRKAG